jgi:hypothetical protein
MASFDGDEQNFGIMPSTTVAYKEILTMMVEESKLSSASLTDPVQKDVILNFICKKFNVETEQISKSELIQLNQNIATFFSCFVRKYNKPKYSRKIQKILLDKWVLSGLSLPSVFSSLSVQTSNISNPDTENHPPQKSKQPVGRKGKLFEEKKTRAQMKDSSQLRQKFSPGVIKLANKQNLSLSGKKDAAFVVKRVSSESGKTAKFARAAIQSMDDLTFQLPTARGTI